MTTDQPNSRADFPPVVALLLGATAGFAAGFWIASRNREAIDEFAQSTSNDLERIREQVSELSRRSVGKLRHLKRAASDRLRQGVDSAEGAVHEAIDDTAAKSHRAVSDTADSLRAGTAG